MKRVFDPPGMVPETGQHAFTIPDSLAIGTSTKAGSTSVHAWMTKYHDYEYWRRYPKYFKWDDYEISFGIIRNPYERVRSFYNDFIQMTHSTHQSLSYIMWFHVGMDFTQFLEALVKGRRRDVQFPRLMVPQKYFLSDADGSIPKKLIRCENLKEEWPFQDKPIRHRNKSMFYVEHDWTSTEREMVQEVFAMDFDLLGPYLCI